MPLQKADITDPNTAFSKGGAQPSQLTELLAVFHLVKAACCQGLMQTARVADDGHELGSVAAMRIYTLKGYTDEVYAVMVTLDAGSCRFPHDLTLLPPRPPAFAKPDVAMPFISGICTRDPENCS